MWQKCRSSAVGMPELGLKNTTTAAHYCMMRNNLSGVGLKLLRVWKQA